MMSKLKYQGNIHTNLAQELKEAEEKINRTQEQVVHRNPQFSKVVSGSTGDDGCTYKLWMKDHMLQEVQLLYNHSITLNEIMEQKQVDIIDMVTYKKKVVESVQSLKIKK